MDYEAQMQTNDIIRDTVNWVLVSGSFVAAGGEDFVTVGNFMAPISTDYTAINPPNFLNEVYYFIDDVFVIEATATDVGSNELIQGVYPNPAQDELVIRFTNFFSSARVTIMDLGGRIIAEENCFGLRHSMDISSLPTGMYLLTMTESNASQTQRIIKP